MGWHRITDKETGEDQNVQAAGRSDLDRLYPTARYTRRTLPREPGEADVWDGKQLQDSPDVAKRIERDARWRRMSRAELADAVVERVKAELAPAPIDLDALTATVVERVLARLAERKNQNGDG